jgi:hypothetical protein
MQLKSTGQEVFATGNTLTLGTKQENNLRTYEEILRPFKPEEKAKTKKAEITWVLSENLKK